jgi:Domain of unknown function (DUF4126)
MISESTVLSACLGLGLAAACGFRVFVPLLLASLASRAGYLHLGGGFGWMDGTPALVAFSVATALEICAYYVPWLDNLLDSAAAPIAVVAGIAVSASVFTGMDPFLKWSLAVIAGGSLAASTQGVTTLVRGFSTLTTGGLANPIVSTLEAILATVLAVLSILLPVLAFSLALLFVALGIRRLRRRSEPVAV